MGDGTLVKREFLVVLPSEESLPPFRHVLLARPEDTWRIDDGYAILNGHMATLDGTATMRMSAWAACSIIPRKRSPPSPNVVNDCAENGKAGATSVDSVMSVQINSVLSDAPTLTPLLEAGAVEISALDLSQPLTPETVAATRRALLDYPVLIFRGQSLSKDVQATFSSQFG